MPWNHREVPSDEPTFQPLPGANPIELASYWASTRRRFAGVFATRPSQGPSAGRCSERRDPLGNRPDPAARPALQRGLDDPDPMVREA